MKKLLLLTVAMLTIGLLPLLLGITNLGFIDFTKQQVPFILETKRMFSTGAPWWSWNTFMGDNFLASYAFYTVTSPFVWLVCLFPASRIWWGILLALYLKTMATSAFAYLYFRKMSFDKNLSIIGGILYSFSSFYICNLFYYHFCEPIMMFPLLLIALERVIRGEQKCYFYLSLTSFGVVFINFYFALSSFILGLMYFISRSVGEKRFSYSIMLKSIGAVLLGILMSSIILLPVLLHLSGSSRSEFHFILNAILGYNPSKIGTMLAHYILRIYSLVLPFISERRIGDSIIERLCWSSIECFVPLFGFLPTIIYIIKRHDWLKVLIIILLIIYLTPLNGIYTLYTNSYYCRWLYGLTFFIILASLYVVKDKIEISHRIISFYLIGCISLIIVVITFSFAVCVIHNSHFEINTWRYVEFALILTNLLCLYVWCKNRQKYKLMLYMTVLCCTFNIVTTIHTYSTNDSQCIAAPFSKNYDVTAPKMEKRCDYLSEYVNTGLFINAPGVYSFHSVFNKVLTPFREKIDANFRAPYFRNNMASRESVSALMSVKEIRDYNNSIEDVYHKGLSFKSEESNCNVYSFEYYIPMGFTYDSYVTKNEINLLDAKADSVDIPLLMLDNLTVSDEDVAELSPYLRRGQIDIHVNIDSIAKLRRQYTTRDFVGDTKGFTCATNFDTTKVVFFSVAADPGFTAYIDSNETKIYNVNLGMSAIVVPPGNHLIKFSYLTPGLKTGTILSLIALLFLFALWVYESKASQRKNL